MNIIRLVILRAQVWWLEQRIRRLMRKQAKSTITVPHEDTP